MNIYLDLLQCLCLDIVLDISGFPPSGDKPRIFTACFRLSPCCWQAHRSDIVSYRDRSVQGDHANIILLCINNVLPALSLLLGYVCPHTALHSGNPPQS
jgi:hypothetical protein